MKTIVRNVITNEERIYINDLSAVENVINAIVDIERRNSNLLNHELREKIRTENDLKMKQSKNDNKLFCYCEKYDLIAYQTK